MGDLSFDNILSSEEVEDLFTAENSQEDGTEEKTPGTAPEEKDKNVTTEVNAENLFDASPESVGSEENKSDQGQEDSSSKQGGGSSPKDSFYSSVATALRDEGILPDLDDDSLKKIKTPEDFAEAIEQQLKSKLDERQKRIDEALNVGVETSEIKRYEDTLSYLDSLKDANVEDESEAGETLRKQLILQDYVNRGFTKERAEREMTKSFTAGTDIEDAKEALIGNKDYFKSSYKGLVDVAKAEENTKLTAKQKQTEEFKKALLDTEEVFEGVKLDKATRQKVFDNITKPIFKDKDGEYYTAIQKFEMENGPEFIKKLGVLFTLTDGFKNLDGLIKGKVAKETKKTLRELESTLRNTQANGGALEFASGVGDGIDPESRFRLDV